MTIAELKQLQAVDGWIDFTATITKLGDIKQRTKSAMSKSPGEIYYVKKLNVADATDRIGVWAYWTQGVQFPIGQPMSVHGMLKEFTNEKRITTRYIDYADVKIAENTPQSSQGSQTKPASTRTAPNHKGEPQGLEKVEGMVRHGLLCAYIQSAAKGDCNAIYKQVLEDTKFVMQGKHYFAPKPDPSIVGDNEPPPENDDSQIPF